MYLREYPVYAMDMLKGLSYDYRIKVIVLVNQVFCRAVMESDLMAFV